MKTAFLASAIVLAATPALANDAPRFQVDPSWPQTLPNNWIMGQAAGIAVDAQDHVWVVQRPRSLTNDEKAASLSPPTSKCCVPAPPVMEFDPEGKLVRAWGGPGEGYNWPQNEHGVSIDSKGFVWIGGNGEKDGQYLKFTRDGKFVLQIGKQGDQTDSNDVTRLGKPADAEVDPETNEVYIADGYFNHRVIVFDADSGAYKRHWGAYGKKPTDEKLEPYNSASSQFGNPVHCVKIAKDGLVYVCDRANNRLQVFRKDGSFVKEFRVDPQTLANGSVWDLVLSSDPQQKFIFMADGANGQISVLAREDGKVLSQWGRHGRQPGQFKWVHNIGIDSKGNLYTAEVGFGRRVQKFLPTAPAVR